VAEDYVAIREAAEMMPDEWAVTANWAETNGLTYGTLAALLRRVAELEAATRELLAAQDAAMGDTGMYRAEEAPPHIQRCVAARQRLDAGLGEAEHRAAWGAEGE
jgi:hypothetical protein